MNKPLTNEEKNKSITGLRRWKFPPPPEALGILDQDGRLPVDGETSKNADDAVAKVATAIQKISTQRSALRAIQNE